MTIQQYVLATLLSESSEVFRKQLRRWKPIHYSMYRQLIGNRGKIGIEIEYDSFPTPEEKIYSQRTIKKYAESESLCKWEITDLFSYGFEVICLFDVTDPSILYYQIHEQLRLLREANFPTTGGLHVNVQMNNLPLINKSLDVFLYWKETSTTGKKRAEFKFCSPFLTHSDLIAQLILTSKKVKINNEFDIKQIEILLENIYRVYPRCLRHLQMDLSTFLRKSY